MSAISLNNEYNKAFEEGGYPVNRLPVMQRPAAPSGYGAADYLKTNSSQMSHPVMSFRDNRNRSGVALQLQVKQDPTLKTVLTVHQRYTADQSFYVYTLTDGIRVLEVYDNYHDKNGHKGSPINACNACEFQATEQVKPSLITQILQNKHPVFYLVGQTPPKEEEVSLADQTPPKSEVSTMGTAVKIATVAAVAVSGIAAYFLSQ